MLEKQRQMMEQRQREFEAKQRALREGSSAGPIKGKAQQQPQPGATNSNHNSEPPSPSLPPGSTPIIKKISNVTANTISSTQGTPTADSAISSSSQAQHTSGHSTASTAGAEAGGVINNNNGDFPSDDAIDEARRRKYTINNETEDPNAKDARKSKNLHDYGQFMGKTKNFARRASYNPDAPPVISPDMQAEMNAGAQKVLEAESKAKEESDGAAPATLVPDTPVLAPLTEESGRLTYVEEQGRVTYVATAPSGGSGDEETSTTTTITTSSPPVTTTTSPPKKISAADADGVGGGITEEERAKFVARDPNDRRSKNVHDMAQFMGKTKDFARRASINVPPPGS
jgi:hypothetical protein